MMKLWIMDLESQEVPGHDECLKCQFYGPKEDLMMKLWIMGLESRKVLKDEEKLKIIWKMGMMKHQLKVKRKEKKDEQ